MPRSTPTVRQQRLGAELRALREQAGIPPLEAASLLDTDRTMISNIEAGRVGISEERFRRLACNYKCPDGPLVEALASMVGERRGKQWWEQYRGVLPAGFLDLAEMEHHARRLRTAQTVRVPGLLQTEDYARAVFELAVPPLPRLEVELRVAHRMKRATVLGRVPYTAIVHEAALRIGFGGRQATRAQLGHLLEASERDGVTVLVIPFGPDGFHGAGESIGYAEAAVPKLDTVYLETSNGLVFLGSPTQLVNCRTLLDRMQHAALGLRESRDLIRAAQKET